MRIAVLGLGYVGCVTAACLAEAGHWVVGIDPAPEKVEAFAEGRATVVEPGLAELLADAFEAGRIAASGDIATLDEVDVAIVCVGTPSAPDGSLGLDHVETVVRQIGARLRVRGPGLTLMLRSTVLPGTTESLVIPWIEEESGLAEGEGFSLVFCPEFLRESSAVHDFFAPPYTVLGARQPSSAVVPAELLSFLEAPVHVVSPGVAEGLKYASNAFHAVKVAFANEMGRALESAAVDARDVMRIFVQDRELNVSARYLRPGFAFGGSCLPKDVRALSAFSRERGVPMPVLDSLLPSNEAHIDRVVRMVVESGARSVAQLGLTFKPGTDDLRESPFVALTARLAAAGIRVRAFDPIVRLERLIGANRAYALAQLPGLESILVGSLAECLDGAELVLLANPNAEITDELVGRPLPVIDLSGMLAPGVERRLRDRPAPASYAGAAW
ncbi:nucleotide sugar dehydrogenase [Salinibacterium soli]|uniref:UDP-glucose 6-dehydrogenase n=1 Tax=Antiquaquibacter soli TaxID=3064523 RepID=A0ABT9BJ11_9MICO|nr:nucleotide sugar dehydrogenase [Protaetiibacter sp. WY-16]MDO7881016.1 nucleotide sugar dehydrogenase [Protaetiibacter sp. WY-16]